MVPGFAKQRVDEIISSKSTCDQDWDALPIGCRDPNIGSNMSKHVVMAHIDE